jgi:hypothetical protein
MASPWLSTAEFGKTTAMRACLVKKRREAEERWHASLGEPAARAWTGIS